MEKRVFCQLNGDRKVIGVLRGYDVRETISYYSDFAFIVILLAGFGISVLGWTIYIGLRIDIERYRSS